MHELAEALILRQPVGQTGLIAELRWVAEGIVASQIRDHIRGATHYVTAALYNKTPPAWTRKMRPVATMGQHVFFVDA